MVLIDISDIMYKITFSMFLNDHVNTFDKYQIIILLLKYLLKTIEKIFFFIKQNPYKTTV